MAGQVGQGSHRGAGPLLLRSTPAAGRQLHRAARFAVLSASLPMHCTAAGASAQPYLGVEDLHGVQPAGHLDERRVQEVALAGAVERAGRRRWFGLSSASAGLPSRLPPAILRVALHAAH